MRRNGTVHAAAYALAMAAMLAAPSMVRAGSFDARWSAMDPPPKGDRLNAGEPVSNSKVVFLNDPRGRMTVVQKINEFRVSERKSPVRTVPTPPLGKQPDENARKAKEAMDGCEPSFSPVTTPSMARVTGRCIAALETPMKVASVLR